MDGTTILDLRERMVASVAIGKPCRAAAEACKVGCRCGEVVATGAHHGKSCGQADGGKRALCPGWRQKWLLARLKEKPDLTLHALRA